MTMQRSLKSFWCRITVVLLTVCCACAVPALADQITDVSSNSSITVTKGSSVDVSFGTWTYAAGNSGSSPDPLSLQIQAYIDLPAGASASIPGASTKYFPGYVLSGYLESVDGSVVVPLDDPNADKLGLAPGSLVAVPGVVNGTQAALFSANLSLTQSAAADLFGSAATQSWTSDAVLVLTNEGQTVTFQYAGASSTRSAFSEPGLSGAGTVQNCGVTLQVLLDQPGSSRASTVPEPGSAALAIVAFLSSGLAIVWYRSRSS